MKRLLALITAAVLCACGPAMPAAAAEEETPDFIRSGDWNYRILENGTASIEGYHGPAEAVIPEKIDGKTVTEIGDMAFLMQAIQSVEIPDTVVSIGRYAFGMCRQLKEINLPPHLERLGASAFMECRRVEKVEIPDSVSYVGGNPFACCYQLSEIILPEDHPYLERTDGVLFSKPDRRLICVPMVHERTEYTVPEGTEIIADQALMFGVNLESVTIPDSVKQIGTEAFCRCNSLKRLVIPDSVTELGPRLCVQDKALQEAVLPDGLKEIPAQAFYACEALEKVKLPSGLEKIGRYAFYDCKLEGLEIPDGVEVGEGAFAKYEGVKPEE